MTYIACHINLTPFRPFNEILVADLSQLKFESFSEDESKSELIAYALIEDFDLAEVESICSQFKGQLSYSIETSEIAKENWNKKWEENFEAIMIEDFCLVRAPFHSADPKAKYEVVIEPKMSFGTGHHQTTQMMIELMQMTPFQNLSVLDMGSGTGILAILAKKMGAGEVDAIDTEEWAYENMQENALRNDVIINSFLGDVKEIQGKSNYYDLVFANINKNILLEDMPLYDAALKPGGVLFLSGFFDSDKSDLLESNALKLYDCIDQREKDKWCALKLVKKPS